ncbi:MAG: PH domain-containing protein [Variovorax sp.]
MSSETDAGERRLHPASFLFTLLMQLRQFAVPLLGFLFLGRRPGSDYEQYALVGVVVMSVYSLAQYFTYRYRIDADAVVVRSGVFQRNLRHIPFARIRNVSLHQNVLHRLFRVAEVRLESAGAAKPEAQMRVLRLADAHALERQVRGGAPVPAAANGEAPLPTASAAPEHVLLALPTVEVLKLGVISNRGMLIAGVAVGGLAQVGNDLIGKFFREFGPWLYSHFDALHISVAATVAAGVVLLLRVLLGLRLLSVVWALLQFHGFVLSESGGRLSMQRGLLTRMRASLPRHRIQAWTMHEGVLHRWFGRRSLRVDSAVAESRSGDKRSLRDLVPIASPAQVDALVSGLLASSVGSAASWPLREWHALPPQTWWRRFAGAAVMVTGLCVALALVRTPAALFGLTLLPVLAWSARHWVRHSAWSVSQGMVAFRGGWLGKHWRFAEVRKLQALELRQSPIDRRLRTASLHFDTVGAGSMEPPLAIPYLPLDTARRIYDELATKLD